MIIYLNNQCVQWSYIYYWLKYDSKVNDCDYNITISGEKIIMAKRNCRPCLKPYRHIVQLYSAAKFKRLVHRALIYLEGALASSFEAKNMAVICQNCSQSLRSQLVPATGSYHWPKMRCCCFSYILLYILDII